MEEGNEDGEYMVPNLRVQFDERSHASKHHDAVAPRMEEGNDAGGLYMVPNSRLI